MNLTVQRIIVAGGALASLSSLATVVAAANEDGPPAEELADDATEDALLADSPEERGADWPGWTCDELTPDLCELEVETGSVDVRGGLTVKYWIYSGVPSAGGGDTGSEGSAEYEQLLPIVMLHGGPGWPHDYMIPLKQQACRGRDVVFYDQAGCGESALPPVSQDTPSGVGAAVADRFPWLLDPSYYTGEELPAVLSHLGLGPGRGRRPYHLLGSSWGTILAQLFVLDSATSENAPSSMVLSGPLSDAQSYIRAQWDEDEGSLGSLPPFVQGRVKTLESAAAYSSPEYGALDEVLTTFFTCRTAPLPDCFARSAGRMNTDIYAGMQGPSEFAIGGTLGTFNVTGRLGEIGKDTPVLLTSGKYDTMRPSVVDAMERAIPTVERITFERSGHVSMIDEPGPMNDAVAEFLGRVEAAMLEGAAFVPRAGTSKSWDQKYEPFEAPSTAGMLAWWYALLGTILAFAVGVLVGNCSGNRHRRQGYDTIVEAG